MALFDLLDSLFDPKPQRKDGTPKWRLEFPASLVVRGVVLVLMFVVWICLGIVAAVIDGELR